MVISEIYALGSAGVSAFVIVENGVMRHYGSHCWKGEISFEGVSSPVNDTDCEILAVICGLMMCRNNGRKMVNIYTCNDNCRKTYMYGGVISNFSESLKRYSEGLDIFADNWPKEFYKKPTRSFYENPFVEKLYELIKKDQ